MAQQRANWRIKKRWRNEIFVIRMMMTPLVAASRILKVSAFLLVYLIGKRGYKQMLKARIQTDAQSKNTNSRNLNQALT
jgi:hypothetical protein